MYAFIRVFVSLRFRAAKIPAYPFYDTSRVMIPLAGISRPRSYINKSFKKEEDNADL